MGNSMCLNPSESDKSIDFKLDSKSNKETFLKHRGIENLSGDNNCFVNVVIQALWHVDAFRLQMLQMIPESQTEYSHKSIQQGLKLSDEVNISLMTAVCAIFSDYMYDKTNLILNPSRLRETLSLVSGQFKLGAFADSNEAFDTILQRLHDEHSKCQANSTNLCLSHRYR